MLTLNKVLLAKIENSLFAPVPSLPPQIDGDTVPVKEVQFDGINALFAENQELSVKPSIIRQEENQEPIAPSQAKPPKREEPKQPEIAPQPIPVIEEKKEVANNNEPLALPTLNNLITEDAIPDKKYKIDTNENSTIKLRPGYSTDHEGEKKLVDLINDANEDGWEEKVNTNDIRIITKNVEGSDSLLLKTFATINFPLSTIVKAINTFDIRTKWDKGFYDMEVLDSRTEDNAKIEIIYSKMHFPWPFSDRDWVQQKTYWANYGGDEKCALFHYTSVKNDKKPEKDKPVRGEMIIGGQYFHQVGDNVTKIVMINHADVKMGKKLMSTVNKKAPDSPKQFILNLRKGCELV